MENNLNLKPFNLDQALAGDPICTESGEDVTQLTMFNAASNSEYCLAGVCDGYINVWRKDGSTCRYDKNLRMKPKKVVKWVSVAYNQLYGSYYTFAIPSDSLEQAKKTHLGQDISHHMIEVEI